jgi:hypothetical protein
LRRLKGSGDRKTKMSGETKIVFDQLTEDAMKLMENGEYGELFSLRLCYLICCAFKICVLPHDA